MITDGRKCKTSRFDLASCSNHRSTRNHFPMVIELIVKALVKSPQSQVVVFASRITSFVSHRIRRSLFL